MKIFDIEVPDELLGDTLKRMDQRLNDDPLPQAWVGSRSTQISAVLYNRMIGASKKTLEVMESSSMTYITDQIDIYVTAKMSDYPDLRDLRSCLIGAFRLLWLVKRCLKFGEFPKKQRPMSRKVYQVDPLSGEALAVWDSLNEAARGLGLSQGSISNAAHGRTQTAGGYKWSFDAPSTEEIGLTPFQSLAYSVAFDAIKGYLRASQTDEMKGALAVAMKNAFPHLETVLLEEAIWLAYHNPQADNVDYTGLRKLARTYFRKALV